jgi:hypothetical protein
MSSQGHRIYADGVQRKHKNGPQLCDIQIVEDELLVKLAAESSHAKQLPLASIETSSNVSTSSSRVNTVNTLNSESKAAATSAPQQQLLAKLNLKTLFHRTDPLLLAQINSNSVVIHRHSEAGRDGLLLMFENTAVLEHFLHSMDAFKKDRRNELEALDKKAAPLSGVPSSRSSVGRGSINDDSGTKARTSSNHNSVSKDAVSPQEKSRSVPRERVKKAAANNSTPTVTVHRINASGQGATTTTIVPASASRPSWDSTPAGVNRAPRTPHGTTVFQSPSPVQPSSATPASSTRRGVRFDSESPTRTTPPPDAAAPGGSGGVAAVASGGSLVMSEHHHPSHLGHHPQTILSPSGEYYSSSPFYRTGSLGARTADTTDGLRSHGHHHQDRMPSLSYLSTASSGAATAFSRTTSAHVDAYLDRSSRIQHYMDTLQQSTLERERLLEDLFEERDRKRRAFLRQAEYAATDDDIKASVHERFSRSKPESLLSPARSAFVHSSAVSTAGHHNLSPQPRTPPVVRTAQQYHLSSEQVQLVARLKGMLAEIPSVDGHEDDHGYDETGVGYASSQQRLEEVDVTLVEEIKRLLALESDFEALKYDDETTRRHPTTSSQGGANPTSLHYGGGNTAGRNTEAVPQQLHNHSAVSQYDTLPADDLQAAVAAEARMLSTLRYGTIPIPKARPVVDEPTLSAASPAHHGHSSTATSAPSQQQLTFPSQESNRNLHGNGITSGGISPLTPNTTSPHFSTPLAQSDATTSAAAVIKSSRDVGIARAQLPLEAPQQKQPNNSLESTTPASPLAASAPPSLWKEVPDAATGKSYYVHKETKKTTWKRSETDLDTGAHVSSPAAASPVTPTLLQPGTGWVAKKDPASGKTFYFHKGENRTTWKIAETHSVSQAASTDVASPIAATPGSGSAASPLGWIAKKDPSGKTFYSNASLKKTTWKLSETDIETTASVPASVTQKSAVPVSPAGWVARVDANTGRSFYSNAVLKKTTWKIEDTDLDNLGSPQQPADVAVIAPASSELGGAQLPQNWKVVIDKTNGKSYYYNTETKKSQWTRPTE